MAIFAGIFDVKFRILEFFQSMIHEFLTEKMMSIICQMHAVKIWPQIAIFAGIFAVKFRILEFFQS
jgi:hypothetical protein